MDILALAMNYWPEMTGSAVFTTGKCEYLASAGHRVTVCTAFPYYPEWRISSEYSHRIFAKQAHNGVDIVRTLLYVPRRPTAIRRILHEASFVASSLASAISRRRPDVLFVASPPLGNAATAMLLKRRWKIPYVFHVTDLAPDTAVDLGMLPRAGISRALYALERMAYRQAAFVSTLTEAMCRKIVAKGFDPSKVRLLPDWADPELFMVPPGSEGQLFRTRFGLEGKFLVVHAGNMGAKQGLDVILRAAERCREPGVIFLLVGGGAARADLEAQAAQLRLSNVMFLPLQPRETFLEMLAASDLCLIAQQRTVGDIVFPSKTLTLLAAGRPVVASLSPGSEIARVMTESGGGVVVAPEDPAALLDAVMRLREDPARRASMGERGRAYARVHWDRDRILRETEAEIAALTARRDPQRSMISFSPP